jgi:hypothetical protein
MRILARVILAGAIVAGVGTGQSPGEEPRPLSKRGLENLEALARLFGYVRYFHPSDAAAAADWEQIAIDSVNAVENAQDAVELASALRKTLDSVTVGVEVFPSGKAPTVGSKPGPYLIEWRHQGVGLSDNNTYYSERVTRPASGSPDEIDMIRADLPGGVSCLVPRVLYTEKQGVFRLRNFGGTQGSVANRDCGGLTACVLDGSYAAMPKIA